MRIEIGQLEQVYEILKNPPVIARVQRNHGGVVDSIEVPQGDQPRGIGIHYTGVGLPYPLAGFDLFINRHCGVYNAYSHVIARTPLAFKDVTNIFAKKIQESGFSFPDFHNDLGLGGIIDSRGYGIFGIIDNGNDKIRDIGMGINGAIERTFPDEFELWSRDFEHETRGFQFIVAKYIEACYENYTKQYKNPLRRVFNRQLWKKPQDVRNLVRCINL
jgi:hypothetical protein